MSGVRRGGSWRVCSWSFRCLFIVYSHMFVQRGRVRGVGGGAECEGQARVQRWLCGAVGAVGRAGVAGADGWYGWGEGHGGAEGVGASGVGVEGEGQTGV